MGELLNIDAGKPEITKCEYPHAEGPLRAIYYGVFFRDHNGRPQVATDHFYAERKRAEMFIELLQGVRNGHENRPFIAVLSVPVSAEEAGKCSATLDLGTAFAINEERRGKQW